MRFQSDLARGLAWGLTASSIGASWLVLTRLGLQQTLNAYDLVAFRFGIPALILLPLIIRGALKGISPLAVFFMVVGAGVPYGLVLSVGLEFAPAAHGGAFNAGMVPLFTAVLSVLILR